MIQNLNHHVLTETNLRDYFQHSLHSALFNQHLEADEHTIVYLVNMLTVFSRSENLFEKTKDGIMLKPLASYYMDALEAANTQARHNALQRIGDIALFISGLFAESLNRKLIDIEYYINMGGNAYACLSDHDSQSVVGRTLAPVFDELSSKFIAFTNVLAEINEQTHVASDHDLLQLYEKWLKTGNKHTENLLRQHGITLTDSDPTKHH